MSISAFFRKNPDVDKKPPIRTPYPLSFLYLRPFKNRKKIAVFHEKDYTITDVYSTFCVAATKMMR